MKPTPPKQPPQPPPAGEPLVSMAAAATLIGSTATGRAVHPSTVSRWVARGLLLNGKRVRLEGVRVGFRWFTTAEAVERFLAACGGGGVTTRPAPHPASPASRMRASRLVDAKLDAAGI